MLTVILGLTLVAGAGCELFSGAANCPAVCPPDFVCDTETGRCRPEALDEYRSTTPARGLDATAAGDGIVFAAIAPNQGVVTAGDVSTSDPPRVLGKLESPETAAVAVATHEEGHWVAWHRTGENFAIARFDEEGWHPPIAVRLEGEATYISSQHFDLTAAPGGTPHLFVRDAASETLRHLRRNDNGWNAETVDDGEPLGNQPPCEGNPGRDRTGIGWHPDASFVEGSPVVAYYDADCGNLQLARSTEDGWVRERVASGDYSLGNEAIQRRGDVGRFPSLAKTPNGRLAVAYQDAGRGRMMYAVEGTGSFRTQLVDPGLQVGEFAQRRQHLVGAHASLTFDREGAPHIVYLDSSENHPVFASRIRGSWVHSPLEVDAPSGFHSHVVSSERVAPTVLTEQLRSGDQTYLSELVTLRNVDL